MFFPSTIRDQANAGHAAWKKRGYGPKGTLLEVVKEQGLLNMRFLDANARLIIGQIDLRIALK